MSRSRFSYFVPALLSILLMFAATLWSQRTTADVVGTITDASGGVLPNVKVTIHNLDTGADLRPRATSQASTRSVSFPWGAIA
jgi:hypothetical protein